MADEPTDAAPEGDDAPAEDAPSKDASTKDAEATSRSITTPVARKKVVSKRVTPKGGVQPSTSSSARSKRSEDDDESFTSSRYTPPASRADAQLPSPWWVPALMFAFLIVGALVIMLNYMGVFGDAENYRLIIGLGLILGGIVTATQYR